MEFFVTNKKEKKKTLSSWIELDLDCPNEKEKTEKDVRVEGKDYVGW